MRLAQAQGVLQGRRINRVQRYILEILMVLDARRDARRRSEDLREALKRAIVSHDPSRMVDLWPQHFNQHQQEDPQEVRLDSDEVIEEAISDHGPTTWVMEGEVTEEEAERMLAMLSQQTQITLTADELDPDSGWI